MPDLFHSFYTSPLGAMQISCTNSCITRVHFLHDHETIGTSEAPAGAPFILQQAVKELAEYFQGQRKAFTVPLYQEGTGFQQKVWNALLEIPFGKTISYLTLAKRLGDPKAIRAAASTNGKNNIAVMVPCHRVIGSNNDMIGYASGIWRKRWLLEMEAKITWGVQTLF